MAQLSLDEVLCDPLFVDNFVVTRRKEVVNDKGRSTVPAADPVKTFGTVTMASPADLRRLPEDDQMERTISIVSKYRLQGPAQVQGTEYKPDLVAWRGDTYVVKLCEPYPQFGAGWVQALAGSYNSVDTAPSAM